MIRPAKSERMPLDRVLISIVLPVYNESAALDRLINDVDAALAGSLFRYEFVFVNDGSTDDSGDLLDLAAAQRTDICVIHLSRNFGHQAALQAGLQHAGGDAIVVMDSDLQDDPQAICRFVERWQAGYDVVYAERVKRKEGLCKRTLFYGFYRVLNCISDTPIPNDAGNFGLIDRAVVNGVTQLSDCDRYFPGLRSWVGFRQTGITVERHARHDDNPRVSLRGLFRLAKSAIFSFSSAPLTMFYFIAVLSALVCCGSFAFVLYHRCISGDAIPGWTSTIMSASFFGALNALGVSVLGEYVIRIYDQVRARPHYLVARRVNHVASHTPAEQETTAAMPNCPTAGNAGHLLRYIDERILTDERILPVETAHPNSTTD